jgi:peptidyl-prolyl cis-trans isomerase SurA
MSKMEPAIRAYLTKMREEAYVEVAPSYADTGASPKQIKPVYSAYVPPSAKKKKKVERTRYRESTHGFRQKGPQPAPPAEAAAPAPKGKRGKVQPVNLATMKPGKKEKIRYGKAPKETLPSAAKVNTEDAGAVQQAANNTPEPVNPLEPTRTTQKTRFSDRAKVAKPAKRAARGPKTDPNAPPPPDAAEVADRQTQSAPLGLGGNTAVKKKKNATTVGQKTRLAEKNKKPATPEQKPGDAPPAPAPIPKQ